MASAIVARSPIPNPSLNLHPYISKFQSGHAHCVTRRSYSLAPSFCSSTLCVSSLSQRPLRYAVLGAGFAGLSVAWHLLKHSPKESHICVDIYDEVGIGGGASAVAGGLVHPYSPKVKPLWRGAECWREFMEFLNIAEAAMGSKEWNWTQNFNQNLNGPLIWRRGILRVALDPKNLSILNENAQSCLPSCRIETMDEVAAQKLVPDIRIPLNSAYYMPEAVSIHPQRYLQALFVAIKNLAKNMSGVGCGRKVFDLHKRTINNLQELAGEYTSVIICLGAKADTLLELSGKLPLRTCRGVVAHLRLPDNAGGKYPDEGPSILSDAWIAVQGPRNLHLGSTWEWRSRNYSSLVSEEEASKVLQELLPKASSVYPRIKDWDFVEAKGGLRAMPPLTPHGSLPLLGNVDNFVAGNNSCKYWIFGGLGARGLLYHAFLGKLMALAVSTSNENVIPQELISWKKKKAVVNE